MLLPFGMSELRSLKYGVVDGAPTFVSCNRQAEKESSRRESLVGVLAASVAAAALAAQPAQAGLLGDDTSKEDEYKQYTVNPFSHLPPTTAVCDFTMDSRTRRSKSSIVHNRAGSQGFGSSHAVCPQHVKLDPHTLRLDWGTRNNNSQWKLCSSHGMLMVRWLHS